VQDWRKLIVDYRDGQHLFDLHADPREEHDLLPAAAPEASRLRAALDEDIARRAAGWHVRACGGLVEQRVQLLLQADGEVSGVDLEREDDLRRVERHSTGSSWRADLRLTPGKARREVFGKVVEEDASDEDEIVDVPSGSPAIGLRNVGEEPLSYSLGGEQSRRTASQLELSPADAVAAVAPSALIHCWDPSSGYGGNPQEVVRARHPYLRIWYIPPPRQKAQEVDAAVKERLHALGYMW